MRALFRWSGPIFFIGLFFGLSALAFKVPELTGPIVDVPHLLAPQDNADISEILRRIRESGKAQIQILIVPDLQGDVIEQASIAVTDAWKLGDKKIDNGILILVAVAEHKMRIEVGRGLEGDLPDITANRIIRQIIQPYFKNGDYGKGLLSGVVVIVQTIAPELVKDQTLELPEARPSQRSGHLPAPPLLILFIILIVVIRFIGRGGGGGFYGGGGMFGGGGGSSGGGSWSGGGGGFAGGGASGDW